MGKGHLFLLIALASVAVWVALVSILTLLPGKPQQAQKPNPVVWRAPPVSS